MMGDKRRIIGLCVLIFIFMIGTLAFAADKPKGEKYTGTVVSAPADPSGKLAPIALECKDGVYPVKKNAVAEKMQKSWMGKKLDVTGVMEDVDGKKVLTPWVIIESGAKPKSQPTG
ncbi:MAG: hypothetical protein AB1427_04065 [Thermodesulfobacteriota bacterium]